MTVETCWKWLKIFNDSFWMVVSSWSISLSISWLILVHGCSWLISLWMTMTNGYLCFTDRASSYTLVSSSTGFQKYSHPGLANNIWEVDHPLILRNSMCCSIYRPTVDRDGIRWQLFEGVATCVCVCVAWTFKQIIVCIKPAGYKWLEHFYGLVTIFYKPYLTTT